jgi:hypothetical protein
MIPAAPSWIPRRGRIGNGNRLALTLLPDHMTSKGSERKLRLRRSRLDRQRGNHALPYVRLAIRSVDEVGQHVGSRLQVDQTEVRLLTRRELEVGDDLAVLPRVEPGLRRSLMRCQVVNALRRLDNLDNGDLVLLR